MAAQQVTGQEQVLERLNITPEIMGAPIKSSMETIKLGYIQEKIPVYVSRIALEADGIIVLNRVKSHTAFSGSIGSGLAKMLVVGIGKSEGAKIFHQSCFKQGYEKTILSISEYTITRLPILFGIAVVENQLGELFHIESIEAKNIIKREKEIYNEALKLEPVLPWSEIDVLIIDQMGKDIIGTGMCPRIIGRMNETDIEKKVSLK